MREVKPCHEKATNSSGNTVSAVCCSPSWPSVLWLARAEGKWFLFKQAFANEPSLWKEVFKLAERASEPQQFAPADADKPRR